MFNSRQDIEIRTVKGEEGAFDLCSAMRIKRKTTGSYYTPTSLVNRLLDSALDPVIERAQRADEPEAALLDLKVCDPASGSGHFLVAAAQRIARALAQARTVGVEPSPEALDHALRDVVGHCLFGVDVNPTAVELCKISLWMETLEPGKPLTFLDAHIQCGNSLFGATPALLDDGVPYEAFETLTGDDHDVRNRLRKRNREEQRGQKSLFGKSETAGERWINIGHRVAEIEDAPDDDIESLREKERAYRCLTKSEAYRKAHLRADTWCAAFVWPKTAEMENAAPTEDVYRTLSRNPEAVSGETLDEIERLADAYRFFHWHLAFPTVFHLPDDDETPSNEETGWCGGFDAVLGNPPWERVKLQEKEWFASRHAEIASAPRKSDRTRLIKKLADDDPSLHAAFLRAKRKAEAESHFLRTSDRYPLCGRGDINTYSVFAETNRQIQSSVGKVGCILPSGIATDYTTRYFFRDLVERKSLQSLYDFENRKGIFPAVDSRVKFCLLTLTGPADPAHEADFAFFCQQTDDLNDPERRFTLSAEDIARINPNTKTCPIFRTRRDAELTKAIYQRVPVLVREGADDGNPWGFEGLLMFMMNTSSHLFKTRQELEATGWRLRGNRFRKQEEEYVPLYEGKMIHQFTHRFGDYGDLPEGSKSTQLPEVPTERLQDPTYEPLPRYWVPKQQVEEKLRKKNWDRGWLLGWRDICRNTDERTVIATVIPRVGVGNKIPIMLLVERTADSAHALIANLSAFSYDYASRQKIGGATMNFYIYKQLPVLSPSFYSREIGWTPKSTAADWLRPRVLELTYTAWDLEAFARDLSYAGPPFRWNEERRFLLRCELDACFFHLYGIDRDDVDYILETFPIVRRKDEKAHGEYRTKRIILEIYDEMAEAEQSGTPYETRLDPHPAHPSQSYK